MKSVLLAIIGLLLLPSFALAASMKADFSISANNIVTEDVLIRLNATQAYDSFTFTTFSEPSSIVYDGSHSIVQQNDSYIISFARDIKPGENIIRFKMLFGNLVQRSGSSLVFRTQLSSAVADRISVSATLPAGFMLSEQAPQATPAPASITTDGRRIMLNWDFDSSDAAIAVFYTDGKSSSLWLFIAIPLLLAGAAISFFFLHKHRVRSVVSETLSEDEQKVVSRVRQGVNKQKEISMQLEFSKSKMSKVIRKLEEKGLLEKTPFFKTNVIRLKKI
jgi:hypothetical protein